MTTQAADLPLLGMMNGFRRFSVPEYHRLIEAGILAESEKVELLEGYLVRRLTGSPPHACAVGLVGASLRPVMPSGWMLRAPTALTLSDSEPEPDGAVVRGNPRTYIAHHPGPSEIGLVIEVADSTLAGDRADKVRIYARAGIVCYWIVNLVDNQIEVYTSPSGPTAAPTFAQRVDYRPGDQLPLVLGGVAVAQIAVSDLLP